MEEPRSWKQVPPELVFNHESVWTTAKGEIRVNDKVIKNNKTVKGKHGYYSIVNINGHTCYFHRLVYFAHSGKSIKELQNGRVIFKNVENPKTIVNENGIYRCWYEDLMFESTNFDTSILEAPINIKDATHPVYGEFQYGKWIPLYTIYKKERKSVKSTLYEICLLDNSEMPCIVRNIERNKYIKYHFNSGHDGYITIVHNNTPTNFLVIHIMLASAFPSIPILQTADHIDDNPKNHNIINVQWLTIKDNSIKGQITQPKVREKKPIIEIPDEIWKPLPINEYTLELYSVSNRGRVKKNINNTISSGSRIRGKKYSYTTIATSKNIYTKYYIHQLVYITFHGSIPEGNIILHNDMVPLTSEGTYRNWAEDLRAGNRSENGNEYHEAKRFHNDPQSTPVLNSSPQSHL